MQMLTDDDHKRFRRGVRDAGAYAGSLVGTRNVPTAFGLPLRGGFGGAPAGAETPPSSGPRGRNFGGELDPCRCCTTDLDSICQQGGDLSSYAYASDPEGWVPGALGGGCSITVDCITYQGNCSCAEVVEEDCLGTGGESYIAACAAANGTATGCSYAIGGFWYDPSIGKCCLNVTCEIGGGAVWCTDRCPDYTFDYTTQSATCDDCGLEGFREADPEEQDEEEEQEEDDCCANRERVDYSSQPYLPPANTLPDGVSVEWGPGSACSPQMDVENTVRYAYNLLIANADIAIAVACRRLGRLPDVDLTTPTLDTGRGMLQCFCQSVSGGSSRSLTLTVQPTGHCNLANHISGWGVHAGTDAYSSVAADGSDMITLFLGARQAPQFTDPNEWTALQEAVNGGQSPTEAMLRLAAIMAHELLHPCGYRHEGFDRGLWGEGTALEHPLDPSIWYVDRLTAALSRRYL